VSLPASLVGDAPTSARPPTRRSARSGKATAANGDAVVAPMQGTVVRVAVDEGASVAEGDLITVLEAMKMEQPLHAHRSGTVTGLTALPGATVAGGTVVCEIRD